jgi:hypothetical protein
LTGENVELLAELLLRHLPEGERLYPEDFLSDQPERFFIAEMVREQILRMTREEIPYSAGVVIDSFKEEPPLVRIEASILVERESQKGILIGKGGGMLKAVGTAARREIEEFLGTRVYLGLFVRFGRAGGRTRAPSARWASAIPTLPSRPRFGCATSRGPFDTGIVMLHPTLSRGRDKVLARQLRAALSGGIYSRRERGGPRGTTQSPLDSMSVQYEDDLADEEKTPDVALVVDLGDARQAQRVGRERVAQLQAAPQDAAPELEAREDVARALGLARAVGEPSHGALLVIGGNAASRADVGD